MTFICMAPVVLLAKVMEAKDIYAVLEQLQPASDGHHLYVFRYDRSNRSGHHHRWISWIT